MSSPYIRICSVPMVVGLLMAHACVFLLSPLPQRIGIVSFALLCLLLSTVLARQSLLVSDVSARSSSIVRVAQPRRFEVPIDGVLNAFSIDLEDYFHTEVAAGAVSYSDWDDIPSRVPSSMLRMLDLLEEHDTRSTVFVLGWIARKHPQLIRKIVEKGHEIACHSNLHRAVFHLNPDSFYEDTRIAMESIEDASGVRVCGYRAPSFSMTSGTEWAFDVLSELGFKYDSSINPIWHSFYGNPGAPRHPHRVGRSELLEIPVATWRIAGTNFPVGGGAYLRLLPYSYIRAGLASINMREHKPYTIYMHPWEIDAYQGGYRLGWRPHIRQHWGVSTMEDRIARLLESFRFAPISEVHSHLIFPSSLPPTAAPPPLVWASEVTR